MCIIKLTQVIVLETLQMTNNVVSHLINKKHMMAQMIMTITAPAHVGATIVSKALASSKWFT